jgi:hypothetical protein
VKEKESSEPQATNETICNSAHVIILEAVTSNEAPEQSRKAGCPFWSLAQSTFFSHQHNVYTTLNHLNNIIIAFSDISCLGII